MVDLRCHCVCLGGWFEGISKREMGFKELECECMKCEKEEMNYLYVGLLQTGDRPTDTHS